MSTSKRNTAHHGFGRVVGTSDSMNIRACLTGNLRSCRVACVARAQGKITPAVLAS